VVGLELGSLLLQFGKRHPAFRLLDAEVLQADDYCASDSQDDSCG
jgi:hypothetical protein